MWRLWKTTTFRTFPRYIGANNRIVSLSRCYTWFLLDTMTDMGSRLLKEVRACTLCRGKLPLPPRPVLQFSTVSPVVLVGQAPGIRVHESGINWNDPSGKRLREWLDVTDEDFYNTRHFSIVPMGFCYPGTGKSGDLPPRPECAEKWMKTVLRHIRRKKLIILIGQYAQQYFLGASRQATLTDTVRHWQDYLPRYFVLPHPSPRNNIWLRKNPWFEQEVIPALRAQTRPFHP